jgi:hypothetical protein
VFTEPLPSNASQYRRRVREEGKRNESENNNSQKSALTLQQSRISGDSRILANGAKNRIFAAIKSVNVNSWQRERERVTLAFCLIKIHENTRSVSMNVLKESSFIKEMLGKKKTHSLSNKRCNRYYPAHPPNKEVQ